MPTCNASCIAAALRTAEAADAVCLGQGGWQQGGVLPEAVPRLRVPQEKAVMVVAAQEKACWLA